MFRWLRAFGLVLGIGLVAPDFCLAQTQALFISQTPTPRVDYWQARVSEIDQHLAASASLASVRMVFIGDSITDFWRLDANPWFPGKFCGRKVWDQSFGESALNLGVSGDRIEHVLYRLLPKDKGGEGWLDRADLQPETIFLMLGVNNSFDAEQPAVSSITKGVEAVITQIHERKPAARIVVQSLLPTDDEAKNRDLIQPVNANLRAFVEQNKGLRFLDLYSLFVDAKGLQKRELFNDSLHPSREGYGVWRDGVTAFATGAGR